MRVSRWRAARPGPAGWTLLGILAAGLLAAAALGLGPQDLLPREGGGATALRFFRAALEPALDYEDPVLRERASQPYVLTLLLAFWRTLAFACAAILASLGGGFGLGFLASSSWWEDEAEDPGTGRLFRGLRPAVQAGVRLLIGLLRSVHELLWAVLFSAAFGLQPMTAVLALALPYTGNLAKIWSEMLDEAPAGPARALRQLGARPLQVFLFGRLPRALPDMAAYGFYQLECAIRSSMVLGFFGVGTLGLLLRQSFLEVHFREVWTVLYLVFALVLFMEAWSGRLRRRWRMA